MQTSLLDRYRILFVGQIRPIAGTCAQKLEPAPCADFMYKYLIKKASADKPPLRHVQRSIMLRSLKPIVQQQLQPSETFGRLMLSDLPIGKALAWRLCVPPMGVDPRLELERTKLYRRFGISVKHKHAPRRRPCHKPLRPVRER